MQDMSLAELIRDREERLLAYGGAKYVKRYRALLEKASANEDVKRAIAITFYKLLAVKDEYEVARLHTDPAFRAALAAQFEGAAGNDYVVKFNLASPALSHGNMPKRRPSANGCGPCSAVSRNSARCAAACSIRSAERSSAAWNASSPMTTKPR